VPSQTVRRLAMIGLVLLLALIGLRCSRAVPEHPFFSTLPPPPWAVAHRGGSGPENTLAAFHRALAQGADVLEVDVRSSADGVPVLLHDETVDRTTDGYGAVADLTVAELRQLDAAAHWSPDGGRTYPLRGRGITIPTLAEVLTAFPDTPLLLDLKDVDAGALCTLLRDTDRQQRVLVAAFPHTQINAFRQRCPDVATGLSRLEAGVLVLLNAMYLGRLAPLTAEAAILPPQIGSLTIITPRLLATARQRNLPIFAWTIDEPQEMRNLLELGVDGLLTTYPERMLLLLGE
jgi:glycerophosphoryl diester phosphodiesterase